MNVIFSLVVEWFWAVCIWVAGENAPTLLICISASVICVLYICCCCCCWIEGHTLANEAHKSEVMSAIILIRAINFNQLVSENSKTIILPSLKVGRISNCSAMNGKVGVSSVICLTNCWNSFALIYTCWNRRRVELFNRAVPIRKSKKKLSRFSFFKSLSLNTFFIGKNWIVWAEIWIERETRDGGWDDEDRRGIEYDGQSNIVQ